MIAIDYEGPLREETDPVIWTNIAHALACEVNWGFPTTPDSRIVSWEEADFSRMAPRELLWIGGHGSSGFLNATCMTGEKIATKYLLHKTKGLKKGPDGAPVLGGITLQNCHGGEVPDESIRKEFSIARSVQQGIVDTLRIGGFVGIPVQAYLGPAISAPVPATEQTGEGLEVQPTRTLADGGNHKEWSALSKNLVKKLKTEWSGLGHTKKAETVAAETSKLYSRWIGELAKEGNLMSVSKHGVYLVT